MQKRATSCFRGTVCQAPETKSEQRNTLLACACFAGVAALAHFLYFRRIGLYEDDYIYTLGCYDWGWAKWWDELVRAFTEPVQGRPLNHAFRRTLNFITLRGDTLVFAQIASWLLLVFNATLLFKLARKYLGVSAALCAGLAYLLYPADNSRQILMHQSDLLFGTTLCLLGLHAFSRGKGWLGWFFGLCCLVNYESFFLPLAVAPFLPESNHAPASAATGKQGAVKRIILHGLVFVALGMGVVAARALLGEARANGLGSGMGASIAKSLQALWMGPSTGLQSFGAATTHALQPASSTGLLMGLSFISLGILLFLAQKKEAAQSIHRRKVIALAGVGLLAWSLAYALCIRPDNSPPTQTIGRLSGVHVAGSIGFSLLFASLTQLALSHAQRAAMRLLLVGGLALGSALMVGHGLWIQQHEYATHWAQQGKFWREILPLVKDLREGEPILMEMELAENALPHTNGFPAFGAINYHPTILHHVSDYPKEWKSKPRVFGLWNRCASELRGETLLVKTPEWFWEGLWPEVKNGHFIYLHATGNGWERVGGEVNILGRRFQARAPESGVTTILPNKRFHQLYGGNVSD